MTFKSLDDLLKSCKKIAKEWDKKTVPLNYLKRAIQLNRLKTKDKSEQVLLFIERYNKVLDNTYVTCAVKADAMDSKSVSLVYLEECIKQVKEAFGEGIGAGYDSRIQ